MKCSYVFFNVATICIQQTHRQVAVSAALMLLEGLTGGTGMLAYSVLPGAASWC